ncbi:hypothetical protein [Oryzomonas rubra]|uniref:Uncharacterized protein n=1 Tax=Oryzomonas rubra TaxID=2509454 RepID=A0A5A9XAV3_9BACT|nr:hypothetical protein [Oryzomonas rubra]KAA0888801.1 hypothetical protein ET418_15590 [Oryzomonas rubra]
MSDTVDEGLDNTSAIANIVETGDLHEVQMLLGDREKIRHAGVIRPGIKVPMKECTKEQRAVYDRMLDEGHGFSDIDAEMLKLAPRGYTKKTCLFPSNCDYFTIRDEDFKRPADAEYIRKNYADPDGKVRRIPCWLPLSDIEKVIPHNFRAFDGGANLRCVSFYDGPKLKFRYIPKDTKLPAKPDVWKVLDSDDEDVATKACGYKVVFGGMYRVYVPGCRGAGEIVVPTRSWYGLGESVAILRRVRGILGRFDGLFNGNAFFELCKVSEVVKTPDGKKQQQWIVTIELAVDPMELARYAEPQAVAARSLHALSALTGVAPAAAALPPTPAADLPFSDDAAPVEAPAASSSPDPVPQASQEAQKGTKAGIDALNALVAPQGLFLADMDNLAASMYGGSIVDDLDYTTLREFYGRVATEIDKRGAAFADDVKALRAA